MHKDREPATVYAAGGAALGIVMLVAAAIWYHSLVNDAALRQASTGPSTTIISVLLGIVAGVIIIWSLLVYVTSWLRKRETADGGIPTSILKRRSDKSLRVQHDQSVVRTAEDRE